MSKTILLYPVAVISKIWYHKEKSRKVMKRMLRLLIVDSSEPYTSILTEVLSPEFEICSCSDGETALELLLSFKPDVLIINLHLPFKDGLTVLQETAWKPRIILAITSVLNQYIERRIVDLGVTYTMITPSINALRVRLMDMVFHPEEVTSKPDLQAQTATHLHILGMPAHLDGYRLLIIGIPIFCKDPHQKITKELYPSIASIINKDGRSVEHSIRHAIETIWKKRDETVWAKYFPPDAHGKSLCPTNKVFLARMAQILQL